MKRINFLVSALFAVAMVSTANAQTVMVLGVGSSAQFKEACVGAFLSPLLGGGVGKGHHYTIKGNTSAGNPFAKMHDSRNAGIADEPGNFWVVWDSTATHIWAYHSVDTIVGARGFFAQPRTQLELDPAVETTAGLNLISANLFGGQADELSIPAAVYNALNNAHFTAAFIDIRPEDTKFGQCRVASTLEAVDYTGLGYGTTPVSSCLTTPTLIGTPILSAVKTPPTKANPVAFNISGTDPFTGTPIPAHAVIPIGAAPIVFVVNKSDTTAGGLGAPGSATDVSLATIQSVYTSGAHCDTGTLGAAGGSKPLTVYNREPLSGTFNTTEFTNFRLTATHHTATMEFGVNPSTPTGNPLNQACGIGTRKRGIGTGEVISGVSTTPNSITFTFFSYSNIQPLSGTPNFGYLTLNGHDPIFATGSNPGQQLPVCNEPCPLPGGASFPNVRNGTYRSWSVLRVVTDAKGTTNYTNTKALVVATQANVNNGDPDYIPFLAQGVQNGANEPGFQRYRSHFAQEGSGAPSNGLPNGVGTENGGDMGGCMEPNGAPPGVLSCRQ